jgi:hypothetical protein
MVSFVVAWMHLKYGYLIFSGKIKKATTEGIKTLNGIFKGTKERGENRAPK